MTIKTFGALDDSTTGTYKVRTSHKTFYIIDMDLKEATRYPASGRGALWKDGETWVFDSIFCKLENSMYFDIPKDEGEYTWRISTPVTSIVKIEGGYYD